MEDGDGDQWAWTKQEGSGRLNPISESFGAVTFGTNGVMGNPQVNAVTDHGTAMNPDLGYGYLDLHMESLRNVAYPNNRQPELPTPHVEPRMPIRSSSEFDS